MRCLAAATSSAAERGVVLCMSGSVGLTSEPRDRETTYFSPSAGEQRTCKREVEWGGHFQRALVAWERRHVNPQPLHERGLVRHVGVGRCERALEQIASENLRRLHGDVLVPRRG